MARNFTSPVGRLVQGDAFQAQTTDQQGNPRVVKTGPNAGQPSPQWFVGVAFAKTDPAFAPFHAELDAEARAAWPHLFPNPDGPCVLPTFAMKLIDGDGFDTAGKPWSTREGFAGHWVFRFTSGFAPKVVKPSGPGVWSEVTDPRELKAGYFVRVAGNVKSNENAQKPGMYLNFNMVEIAGYGAEIVQGPSAQDAFGTAAALPAGASAVPIATAPLPGALPVATVPPPAAMVPPPAPPVPVAVPPPPAAPVRQMLPAAGGASYESFIAGGWTDALLVQNGYMAP